MVFDIVHVINNNMWSAIKGVSTVPGGRTGEPNKQ